MLGGFLLCGISGGRGSGSAGWRTPLPRAALIDPAACLSWNDAQACVRWLIGNAWEWTEDCHADGHAGAPARRFATGSSLPPGASSAVSVSCGRPDPTDAWGRGPTQGLAARGGQDGLPGYLRGFYTSAA